MYNDLKMIELYSKDEVLFNELRKGFYIFLILSLVILILFGWIVLLELVVFI